MTLWLTSDWPWQPSDWPLIKASDGMMTPDTWVSRLSSVPLLAVAAPVAGLTHADWPPEVRHTRGTSGHITRGAIVIIVIVIVVIIIITYCHTGPRSSHALRPCPELASGGWPWSRRWGWASGWRRPAQWWSRTRGRRCTGAWNREN